MTEHAVEFTGTERFHVLDRLGRGAMGVVYRAHDRERDAQVALKLLRRADPQALLRFKREFRALTDVTHRNLVTLYELVSAGDQWFFTMELVTGVDFLSYVRGDPPLNLPAVPLDAEITAEREGTADTLTLPHLASASAGASANDGVPRSIGAMLTAPHIAPPAVSDDQVERLRLALRELVDGVRALHDAGQLHRDIKPSNVLVEHTEDGERVVVLDFGVVTDLAAVEVDDRRLVGTPAYMAPEQAAGERVTEASDWYSVGVMLYEALTGRRPFLGSSDDVMAAKRARDPRPPRAISDAVPLDLDELCMRLLDRDPAARPTGGELADKLGGGRSSQPTIARVAQHETELVGREAHLTLLREAYAATRRGEPRTVFVHGTSGVGKSALLARFVDELRVHAGAVVLSGRCYERESVPYKALDALLDGLSRHLMELPRRDVWDMMPRDAFALARLFPVLRQVEAVLGSSRAGLDKIEPHDLRRRAFDALRELLGKLARGAPLVLYIDDLQWGDLDSAALLEHVTRGADAPPLLLLAAYRREDTETSPLLRSLLSSHPTAMSLSIDPLSPDEAAELALTLLGDGNEVLRHLSRSIARESGGNPFFVCELAAFVRRTSERGKDFSLGVISLDEVLMTQIDDLAPAARALLEVVSVAGRPVSQAVAIGATPVRGDEQAAIAALRNANLVRTRGARDRDDIECFHDRIRVAVVANLPQERLRDCHARLGEVLEASGEADAETLAFHWEGAGDLDRAGRFCVEAADAAAEALAFDRAAALYRRALSLRTFAPADVAALHGRLGDALANVGRRAQAAQAYLNASRTASPADVLEYRRRAGEEFLLGGHIDEGVRALEDVLTEVGLKFPTNPRRAWAGLLTRRAWLRLRGLRFRPRDATEVSAQTLRRIDACWTASVGFGMCDNVRGADFQTRHLLYALRSGERHHIARALTVEAAYASLGGKRTEKRALKMCEMARELADEIGDPIESGWAIGVTGLVGYQLGRFRQALEITRQSEGILANFAGQYWEIETLHLYQVWSLFYLGELAELRRRVPELLRHAQDRGDLYASTNMSTGTPNTAWLVADDVDGARAIAREMMGRWSRQGFHLQHYWDALGAINVDLYEGDGARAQQRVTELVPRLRESGLWHLSMVRVEAEYWRARAALSAAADAEGKERSELIDSARRDAARLRRHGLAFTSALALIIDGGAHAARGERDAAQSALERAVEALDTLDMRGFAAAARWMLGRLVGGTDGDRLVEAAEAALREQSVVAPPRMLRMLGAWFR